MDPRRASPSPHRGRSSLPRQPPPPQETHPLPSPLLRSRLPPALASRRELLPTRSQSPSLERISRLRRDARSPGVRIAIFRERVAVYAETVTVSGETAPSHWISAPSRLIWPGSPERWPLAMLGGLPSPWNGRGLGRESNSLPRKRWCRLGDVDDLPGDVRRLSEAVEWRGVQSCCFRCRNGRSGFSRARFR